MALVIARRFLVVAMAAGVSSTACTLIVLGSMGDKQDYPVGASSTSSSSGDSGGASGSGSSSSSGKTTDPCSLLQADNYGAENPPNECSDCIRDRCADEVQVACNEGKKEAWFQALSSCAQNPWVDFAKPGSGASFWECGRYDNDAGSIAGDSPQARQRQSEMCVRDQCLKANGAPCRLCEVNEKGTGTDETRYLLREDRCGKLFVEHCGQTIIDCCRFQPMDAYVAHCSNTADPDELTTCKGILKAKNDFEGFKDDHPGGWSAADFTCAQELAECFAAHSAEYDCQ